MQLENKITMDLGNPKLFFQDALEVVKFLFGNSMFAKKMYFHAESNFDENGKHLFNEVWISDWWWEVQVSIVRHREADNDV